MRVVSRPVLISLSLTLGALSAGCASGLKVSMVEAAHRKPSNVAVFFTVQTRAGEPVPELQPGQFRIYEDGALVSAYESRQTIINPEVAVEHYTLLLVDMSGSVSESGQVPVLVEAATHFTQSVGQYHKVAVYAFDGGEDVYPIQPFTDSAGASARRVSSLAGFRTRDPSTNLNGAVVRASKVLDEALARAKTPLRFGTLVVFTDGTDRAGRVTPEELATVLEAQSHEVFAIGVGTEIDEKTLGRIGRSGSTLVRDSSATLQAFQSISDRIVAYTRSHYLLSYCSPARAGKHHVTIEALLPEPQKKKGRLEYEFDAAGFGPSCDPNTPPPFAMNGRGGRPAPAVAQRSPGRRIKVAAVTPPKAAGAGNPEEGDR